MFQVAFNLIADLIAKNHETSKLPYRKTCFFLSRQSVQKKNLQVKTFFKRFIEMLKQTLNSIFVP